MSPSELETITIEPVHSATASIIWLHGLGADGHDFASMPAELGLPDTLPLRFIFPHAPIRPITINGGAVMRGWYDILSMDFSHHEDEQGILASGKMIEGLIAAEVEKGIPENRIVLAGFSQGGAIALHTGLQYPRKLAGIMALSTYLPIVEFVETHRHHANQATSIFMAHGSIDPVVMYAWGNRSKDLLEKWGYPVDWHTYTTGHGVIQTEIAAIATWLRAVLV